jgi:SAM-dependent methyltransferase
MWSQQGAQGYDASSAHMYAPEVLGPTVDFLAQRAGRGPALEFAVGTGRVALPLRARGVPVAGIELSEPMAAELRNKPGGDDIPVWIGDMASITAPGEFRLVYLVYNAITCLLTQDQQVECFRNAARHLRAGGRFVIEVFIPDLQRLPPGETARPSTSASTTWGSTPSTWSTSGWSPTTTGSRTARPGHSALRIASCGPPSST